MPTQKLYAGVKLRELRKKLSLTQKSFASRLGVSLSYLNQMENNHRPISAGTVLGLAREFGFDVTQLTAGEMERMVVDMREALADPVFSESDVPLAELQLVASNAPALAHAFLSLHRTHQHSVEQLASLSAALGTEGNGPAAQPWEEVRDFFHYCDNYIDSVDRAAERFAAELSEGSRLDAMLAYLSDRHGVTVQTVSDAPLRSFDHRARVLTLSAESAEATQLFQVAHQIALLSHADLIEATLDLARFQSEAARDICRIGLANYFAGAAVMPYTAFLNTAHDMRHDLERLARRFSASLEQVAHRLSTLQRAGAKGIPFFFVRVDQAGTITKRHSATRLQFARFGGACPLWNVHRAFEAPGRFLRQLAETPDGVRYFCLARDVSKSGGRYHAPLRRYAIGLGCEVTHASALVYADGLDLTSPQAFEPIGIACRICERKGCHQRALPPIDGKIRVNPAERDVLPYSLP